jgi:hypothetical protein
MTGADTALDRLLRHASRFGAEDSLLDTARQILSEEDFRRFERELEREIGPVKKSRRRRAKR